MHDHLRPSKVTWDDGLEVILDMQERYLVWIKEVTRTSGPDPKYEWDSLMSLLDKDWSKKMKEDPTLKDKPQEEWFKKMNLILIDRFPILSRRLEHVNITKHNNELPSTFMERVFSTMYSSQMDTAPPVARALVYITKHLKSEGMDKTVKEHLVKVMRETPNIEKKEEVMTFVYALESDVVAKSYTDKKNERDSMIVNKSSSPIRLSSPSFSPQKIAKEALRARIMGDGDYRDALEIMGFFDDDNFLVKMKDPKEPALCNRKAAKQNLPQLVIKFYESVINWT